MPKVEKKKHFNSAQEKAFIEMVSLLFAACTIMEVSELSINRLLKTGDMSDCKERLLRLIKEFLDVFAIISPGKEFPQETTIEILKNLDCETKIE